MASAKHVDRCFICTFLMSSVEKCFQGKNLEASLDKGLSRNTLQLKCKNKNVLVFMKNVLEDI